MYVRCISKYREHMDPCSKTPLPTGYSNGLKHFLSIRSLALRHEFSRTSGQGIIQFRLSSKIYSRGYKKNAKLH
jgi:hypothetical protein